MNEIKLEDIIPQGSSFTLKRTEKTYYLKPVSLADELWISQTFGDQLQEIMSQVKMKEICRIVFRLLEDDSKQEFRAKDVELINEEGESMTVRLGGAELLMCLVSGYGEKIQIIEALMDTLGASRPVRDKLTKAEEDQKKSQKPIGQKSSTSSQPSTDGPQKKSFGDPRENFTTEWKKSGKGKC